MSLLSRAVERVVVTPGTRRDSYERGVFHLAAGRPTSAVRAFHSFVSVYPDDPAGHRMLGAAHLAAGHLVAGFTHLVLALKILRQDVRLPIPLRETIRLQLEAGLVRLLLLPLCRRLGHGDAADRLMLESLEL